MTSLLDLTGAHLAVGGVVGEDVTTAARAIRDTVVLPEQVPQDVPQDEAPPVEGLPGDVPPDDVQPDDVPPEEAETGDLIPEEAPPVGVPTTRP